MTKTRAGPQARFAFWGKRWRNREDRGRSVAPLSFLPRDTDVGVIHVARAAAAGEKVSLPSHPCKFG